MNNKGNNSLLEKEYARLQNRQTDKSSFIGRNVSLFYFLLFFLYPIAAIYSVFTGGSALVVYINSIVSNWATAFILTSVLILALEAAKFFFGRAVSDDVRQHVWTETSEHIFAFILKLVAFIGVMAGSITLSLTGAPDVAQSYRENKTPVEVSLIDLEAIKSEWDTKIAAERQDIARGEQMKWKGAIIKDGRDIIKQAKANIKDFEQKRAKALQAATAANDAIKSDYNSETAKAGTWFTSFAGAGEILAIIILLFIGNYQSGAEKEVQPVQQGTNSQLSAAVTATPNTQLFSQNTAQRRTIGFQIPNSGYYNSEAQRATNSGQGNIKIGQCKHCGKDYEQTVWNKKFCSDDCRLDYHAQRNNGKRFNPKRYHSKSNK